MLTLAGERDSSPQLLCASLNPHHCRPPCPLRKLMQFELPHGFKRWQSLDAVQAAAVQLAEEWRGQQAFQKHLLANSRSPEVAGFCAVCQSEATFHIKDAAGGDPSWRETMACSGCQLINRWRASLHLYRMLAATIPDGPVYLTEQTTPVYNWLSERLPGVIGSEYVSATARPGEIVDWNSFKLRHEDVTALSMADASLAVLMTFDVLEHVPDYRKALAEFARVLMPGGLMIFTAPFMFTSRDTVVRATLDAKGEVVHHLPAVYHGDPLSAEGVLCFQEFGWDLLDVLDSVGFSRREVITCWAPDLGYYGSFQPFIVAWR